LSTFSRFIRREPVNLCSKIDLRLVHEAEIATENDFKKIIKLLYLYKVFKRGFLGPPATAPKRGPKTDLIKEVKNQLII